MKMRDPAEYPSIRSFGIGSLCTVALCSVLLLICSQVTFAPNGFAFAVKTAVIISAVLVFSAVLAIRSLVMAYQCKREMPQTFDRQCPEWFTVALLLILTAAVLWPA